VFNLIKYQTEGRKGSCFLKLHPVLANDKAIKEALNDIVDYIRANYNMEDFK
jgi:hypothetical protein